MTATRACVLVVDDDQAFARIVIDLLEERGYEALGAVSAEAALTLARRGDVAAAVVDLRLPGASGLDIAERIRAKNPDAQVVILTGHGTLESAIEGLRRGIFGYLQKATLEMSALEAMVRQAVERSRLAVENRRLVAQLEEANRLMGVLLEASTRIAAEPHLDRLLPLLVASAKELSGASAGRVLLFQRSGPDTMVVETGVGDGADSLRGGRLWAGEGIAAEAATSDLAFRFADPRQDPRYSMRCDDFGAPLSGWMCVPLRRPSVLGALIVAGRPEGFETLHEALLVSLARQAALAVENSRHQENAVNFFTHTSELLVQVLERLDIHYPGHSRRVAKLADMLSRRLGLGDGERRSIHFGALLHDIGKMRLDPRVLNEEATAESREAMLKHPSLGLEMLRPITLWEDVLPIVHAHHERWDGEGYPRGLVGEEIPLGARVVAVADAFDAMTRSTPHGRQRSPEEALAELEGCAGKQFDPRIVRLFGIEFRERGHLLDS